MNSMLILAALTAASPVAQAESRPARAAHFVVSSYHTNDDAFDLYSPNDAIGGIGLGLEHDLTGPVSLVGSYTRKQVTSEYFDSLVENSSSNLDREEAALVAGFAAQQITFGPKVRYDVKPMLSAYAVGQALAFLGTVRLDDHPGIDDNVNQLTARSWAPGFVAAGGLELTPKVGPLQTSTFLELGYNWTAQMAYADENIREHGTNEPAPMGDIAFRGFYVQAGLGLRF